MINRFHFHTFVLLFIENIGDDWFWQQGQWNCKHTEDWNEYS